MKALQIFSVLTIFLMTACIKEEVINEPVPGPQGPVGPQGPAGESGFVFEYEDVDFTSPDYEVLLPFPEDFEGLPSDVSLVYLLWDVQEDDNGEILEIWRQAPQTVFTEYGTLLYNFDSTPFDVNLFLDGNFNLDMLGALDTDDWVVRVVVVPGDFREEGGRTSLDFGNYQSVKKAFGLPDLPSHDKYVERREIE